ncbi:hypothetical protein HAT93_03519 [Dickeya solani]|nr:hypothetical protein [Dickeya solani]QKO13425.1 hypothetical protein HAT91_01783 [Dickeya solani]
MSGLRGLASTSSEATKPAMKTGAAAARLAAKGSHAAGTLIATGTGNAISAWQKRAAAIESMKRLNQQRHR